MRSQVWQAFSLLYRYPAFGRLWVGRSISLFGDAFTLIALPLYSDAVLQTDAQGYGLLWSALAVGALIGTLSSPMLSRRLRLGVALPLIALLWGASLLPMVFINELWLACGLLFLGGLMWGPDMPMETTLLQRNVPKAQQAEYLGPVPHCSSADRRWVWPPAAYCWPSYHQPA